jgi:antitoxin component of MazEF toxin-antitoxin module
MYTSSETVIMGERTALALNTKQRASLRTTVPMFIVKQWNLKPGDEVEWSLEVCKDGELVATVRRTAPVKSAKKK